MCIRDRPGGDAPDVRSSRRRSLKKLVHFSCVPRRTTNPTTSSEYTRKAGTWEAPTSHSPTSRSGFRGEVIPSPSREGTGPCRRTRDVGPQSVVEQTVYVGCVPG